MKRKRFISFIISLVLIITLSITVFAQTRHYVYVRDKYGTLMSGATVQFIDDLGTVYTGVTNSSGGVYLDKQSGREYGVNVYKTNYARQFSTSRITYSDSTNTFYLQQYSDYPTYSNPVSNPTISSYFGWRYYNSLDIHRGIDIPKSSGTSIYSCAVGEVTTNTYHNARGYYIIIKHDDGNYSLYQHMASKSTVEGRVTTATKIGSVGATGSAGGYHLHFEISAGGTFSSTDVLDPEAFLN